jgi:hypothetical protein
MRHLSPPPPPPPPPPPRKILISFYKLYYNSISMYEGLASLKIICSRSHINADHTYHVLGRESRVTQSTL